MDRDEYELFQHLPDGRLTWCGLVRSLQAAQVTVWLLADETGNECLAMDPTGSETILSRTPLRGAKRIFQVAYSKALASRAHLLRRSGYDVTSVSGNLAAQFALRGHPHYDLFVIGHGASQRIRTEMAIWLRARYPDSGIVALNRHGQVIDGLRYNAPNEPAATWLPVISAAVGQSGHPSQAS